MGVNIAVRAIARTPPAIFIVAALIAFLVGATTDNDVLINFGWACFAAAILLQIAYLLFGGKRRRGGWF